MARTGLSTVIDEIRLNCELGTADYTVNGVSYWTDDQIQTELDRTRRNIDRELLVYQPEYTTGTTVYKDYYWHYPYVEEYDANNTEIFHLEDAGGTAIGTADYTINYDARHIRFSSDKSGSAFYLTYRSYDVNRTSARIWKQKASHVAQRFDVKSDNHDLKASQLRKQYMDMARSFSNMASPAFVRVVRSDLNAT